MRDTTSMTLCLVMAGVIMILPDLAFATTETFGAILCSILSAMRSATFRAIATLGIIIVGIGALLGKVSWGMAIMVVLGVVLIFGASDIMDETIGTTAAGDNELDTKEGEDCYTYSPA